MTQRFPRILVALFCLVAVAFQAVGGGANGGAVCIGCDEGGWRVGVYREGGPAVACCEDVPSGPDEEEEPCSCVAVPLAPSLRFSMPAVEGVPAPTPALLLERLEVVVVRGVEAGVLPPGPGAQERPGLPPPRPTSVLLI